MLHDKRTGCERRNRYSIAKLIKQRGRSGNLPAWVVDVLGV